MGKNKKKHSKKDQPADDLLDAAALSIKKFRKVTKEIGKLSTSQKLVGGLALAAAGLVYLAAQESGSEDAAPDAPQQLPGHASADADEAPTAPPRKSPKPAKPRSRFAEEN